MKIEVLYMGNVVATLDTPVVPQRGDEVVVTIDGKNKPLRVIRYSFHAVGNITKTRVRVVDPTEII
jgi:hypothetical protein